MLKGICPIYVLLCVFNFVLLVIMASHSYVFTALRLTSTLIFLNSLVCSYFDFRFFKFSVRILLNMSCSPLYNIFGFFLRSVLDCGNEEGSAGLRVRRGGLAHPRDRDHLLLQGRASPHHHSARSKQKVRTSLN